MAEVKADFIRRRWMSDGLLALCARLILGAVFVYASIDKIINPAGFARAVYNYQILPDFLVNLTAIILPWLELTLGIFLIIGLLREGTVFVVTGLLIVFLGTLAFNMARGLDIYCGCFSTSVEDQGGAPMAWYLFRDGLFLVPAFYLFFRIFLRKKNGG